METLTLQDFETGKPISIKLSPNTELQVQEDVSNGKTGTVLIIKDGAVHRKVRVREDQDRINAEFTVLQDIASREH